MELSGISKSDPAEVLLFITVNQHANMWMFINGSTWMDFRSHWNPVREHLKPFTFHCVKARGWNTQSASGQTFEVVEHITEFLGVHQCRAANKAYLWCWQQWLEKQSSAKEIRNGTASFIAQLSTLDVVNTATLRAFDDLVSEAVTDEDYVWALNFVADTLDGPSIPYHIDDDDTCEWLAAYRAYEETL